MLNDIATQESLKIIIGLGNPGAKYHNTRHNIGFMALDAFALRLENLVENQRSKWKTATASGTIRLHPDSTFSPKLSSDRKFNEKSDSIVDEKKILLAKPHTYMNLSGEAVLKIKSFYKSSEQDLIVVSDDLDFTFGQIRFKKNGSGGTHNGLRSVEKHIGKKFYRLRIGVGNPLQKMLPADQFVLGKFNSEEKEMMEIYLKNIADALTAFCFLGIETAMNNYNGRDMLSERKTK